MMITRASLLIVFVAILVAFPAAYAQAPPEAWQIPRIECGGDSRCTSTTDAQGNLYVFKHSYPPLQEVLYVIRYGTRLIEEYDLLRDYPGRIGIRTYLVPLADDQIVVFSYDGDPSLALLNLQTETFVPLPTDVGRVMECDQNAALQLNPGVIFRLGNDGVVFCSLDEGSHYIHLARLTAESLVIERSINMGPLTHPGLRPWYFLAGGMNGKLYVAPTRDSLVASHIEPHYLDTDWQANSLLLRYDLASQTWNTLFIDMASERWKIQGAQVFTPFLSADTAGNMYFWYFYTAEVFDLVKYNAQGEKIWHLTEHDFGGQQIYHPLLVDENRYIVSLDVGSWMYIEVDDLTGAMSIPE